MAHEIDQTVNANGAALYAMTPAWHGLGTVLDHAFTSEEALAQAGLDFTVSKAPMGYFAAGQWHEFPHRQVIVREDTFAGLGVCQDKYEPFQNRDAFAITDDILSEHGAVYEAAGVLRGGAKVWILARLPEAFKVTDAPGDEINEYLLLATGHDGLSSINVLPTGVRVVCMNTYNQALGTRGETAKRLAREGKALRVVHTAVAKDRLAQAKSVFEAAHARTLASIETAKRLVDIPATDAMVQKALDLTLDFFIGSEVKLRADGTAEVITRRQNKRQADEPAILAAIADEWALVGKNGWGVYNGVTRYTDHMLDYRGANAGETRFESLLSGKVDDFKGELVEALVTVPPIQLAV